MYSPYAFVVGQLLSEIPYNILIAIGYWVSYIF